MFKYPVLLGLFSLAAFADPRPQMNAALNSLDDLLPYIAREERFLDKKNEKDIAKNLEQLEKAFASLKHDELLKNDLFAPSYHLIRQNLSESRQAFKDGNKDYAHWRLTEITNQCLDCHSRMPESYSSKYQEKKLTLNPAKFENLFDLGTAQLIVRDYPAAEKTFQAVIEENIQKKTFMDTEAAFRNLLLIRTKITPDYTGMLALTEKYSREKALPMDIQEELTEWQKSLKQIEKLKILQAPLKNDKDVRTLITTVLQPVRTKGDAFTNNYDVHLLASSGLLSRYFFSHPDTRLAPELSFWLGWIEKVLKRTEFFSSGDLFLKQCIRRYPKDPMAQKCMDEYRESIEFEFSGSSGTNIPKEVKKELEELQKLITRG